MIYLVMTFARLFWPFISGRNEVESQGNVLYMFVVCDYCPRGGVCLKVHAGIPPPWDVRHPPPPRPDPPIDHTPPLGYRPPGQQTHPPRSRHPPRADSPGADTPPWEQTPPGKADASIRSMSGRYASYWNAFFFASRC